MFELAFGPHGAIELNRLPFESSADQLARNTCRPNNVSPDIERGPPTQHASGSVSSDNVCNFHFFRTLCSVLANFLQYDFDTFGALFSADRLRSELNLHAISCKMGAQNPLREVLADNSNSLGQKDGVSILYLGSETGEARTKGLSNVGSSCSMTSHSRMTSVPPGSL